MKNDFIENELEYEDLKFKEMDGIVFHEPVSRNRVVNFHGDSSRIKADFEKISHPALEYDDIANFITEFIENKIPELLFPPGLDILKVDYPKITFGSKIKGQISALKLESPQHYFYNGVSAPRNKNYGMRSKIRYNKPFTHDFFENKNVNIGVIYPKVYYTNIANFFKAIQTELVSIYKIPKERFKYTKKEIENFDLKSYQEIMPKIPEVDLAVILVDKSHEILSPEESPYFFCKAEFLKRGINSQEVQIQQVNKFLEDEQIGATNFADHTIALNIYAKLGGIAWTIKPNGELRNELVFGVGATTDIDGQPRIGMTSIFRGDGKYLFGDMMSVVGIADYESKLEQIISKGISDNIKSGLINKEKEIFLIFHLFKQAGRYNEISALEKAIKKFPSLEIKYSFIHIGNGHNFRFYPFEKFSNNNERFSRQSLRGGYIKINPRLAFVALKKNNPRWLKVEIDNRSNSFNIDYIARQVYEFSEISHTSFNKQGSPASIKYPRLMVQMSEKLTSTGNFYLKNINMPDDSLWFI